MSEPFIEPPVSRAERRRRTTELTLAAHATEDERLRARLLDEVVVLNRCVAEAVANRYRGRGVPTDDLHQSAYEGLIKAVHRFDPTVRPDLLTYAVPTIRGEVQRWFRDQSWMVRPPRRIQELQWHVRGSVERLSTATGRPPTEEELSADVGCTVEELRETMRAFGCFQPPSLDRPTGGDQTGTTVGDLMPSEDGEAVSAAEARLMLASVVPDLSKRDQTILYLRFVEELSQREIALTFGVTQMQISRVLERIFRTLRTQLVA